MFDSTAFSEFQSTAVKQVVIHVSQSFVPAWCRTGWTLHKQNIVPKHQRKTADLHLDPQSKNPPK